jgi:hypothetical protein
VSGPRRVGLGRLRLLGRRFGVVALGEFDQSLSGARIVDGGGKTSATLGFFTQFLDTGHGLNSPVEGGRDLNPFGIRAFLPFAIHFQRV